MKIRYYANGARFEPGGHLSLSDILYMRMLRARDDWDVWSILVTGRPLPPCGGMAPRISLKEGAELFDQYLAKWPELSLYLSRGEK